MDALSHHCPSMAKRPCSSSFDPTVNPSPAVTELDHMDHLLESFLNSSVQSLDLSFDRLLESTPSDADQNDMIERALRLGSVLLEAGKRSARKRASIHNAVAWALPPDLTIKVFSMLDTQSLCYAAATCSFFHKCAMDPLCYANIDLRTVVPKVNNVVVSTMIQRAGKALESLKIGILPSPVAFHGSGQLIVNTVRSSADASGFSWNDKRSRQGKDSSVLTRSCLISLRGDNDTPGALLRRLHLHNIERMDNTALGAALSACPSLRDLEVVGLHVDLMPTLESISKHCHLIERLHFESSKTGRDENLKAPTCDDLVQNCPHITSLALRGFMLHDYKARTLVKGFRKLKYVDFSTSYSITGTFLRNLGGSGGGNLLEVLILRDCVHLKEMEVARFLSAVVAGDFKLLRHLDISNREGLASEGHDLYKRSRNSGIVIPLTRLLEERPNLCLLAEFPPEGSFIDIEDLNFGSDDVSLLRSSSESSYSSDQGGNEDYQYYSGLSSSEGGFDVMDYLSL